MPKLAAKVTEFEFGRLRRFREIGVHAVGEGLFLQVTAGGRSWLYRYRIDGRARSMGLGRLAKVDIRKARALAEEAYKLLEQGIDPIDQRLATKGVNKAARIAQQTFKQVAELYIEKHEASWRSEKHRSQWVNTLAAYAYPHIGGLPVKLIGKPHVLACVEPHWSAKNETASRVRSRIELVLDFAIQRELREGPNPALLKGLGLPARGKVAKVRHHTSMPYAVLPRFMEALRSQAGVAARAVEFAILTCARSGEVRGADWSEFDLQRAVWIVPASRMKAEREHRAALSREAVAMLEAMQPKKSARTGLVFGNAGGAALSDMSLLAVLRRMHAAEVEAEVAEPICDVTVHGFRSTFRVWAAEQTSFPSEVAELALAHSVGTKTELAYQRSTMFERRRELAQAWADFATSMQSLEVSAA